MVFKWFLLHKYQNICICVCTYINTNMCIYIHKQEYVYQERLGEKQVSKFEDILEKAKTSKFILQKFPLRTGFCYSKTCVQIPGLEEVQVFLTEISGRKRLVRSSFSVLLSIHFIENRECIHEEFFSVKNVSLIIIEKTVHVLHIDKNYG